MKITQLITTLTEKYGKENVLIHTEHHFQVVIEEKKHDIWLSRSEGLKWRLSGIRQTKYGPPEKLIQTLDAYDHKKTNLAEMSDAVALTKVIDRASRILKQQKLNSAIYCDAGFKDGKARIGYVIIDNGNVWATRKHFPGPCADINQAERLAITEAREYAGTLKLSHLPVYSDSMNAVNDFKEMGFTNVHWIGREYNKVADKLVNLRSEQT